MNQFLRVKKIHLASDHAGFEQKKELKKFLIEELDCEVVDYGPYLQDAVDYPDYAKLVAEAVQKDLENSNGILICGSGVGVCIVANKFHDIRAALVDRKELAYYAIGHDNANVLCLSARFTTVEDNQQIIKEFLTNQFEGDRHTKRINKIKEIEKNI